ncbi:FkbM family methyltransferase [Lentzea atacamensis]|uniref:FkbM family methyltransferase n=1 Tax=Lentzea atacamensis TaxID=531938 RepID=A0A316IB47_9PSEU|nr:FkbM family methyltransferase [Lentzea atacamensis]PWK89574.1 FkbM family methyltransferase [Lentzea atacamensis]RAS60646.1 FkbM family methyltransferase [Lentzea atacamensis]
MVKRTANRFGIDITRNPFPRRLATLCDLLDVRAVLDVGANAGQYATLLRDAGYRGEIVSCEPLAAPFAALSARAANDSRWHVEQFALGAEAGTVPVHVAANSFSSSVLPMLDAHLNAAPESRYVGVEESTMSTVDEMLARHGLDPARTLLKIDVQGYEWEVLRGAARSLSGLLAVQVELSTVSLYAGQRLMGDIVDLLVGHEFVQWTLEPGFSDPRSGRMLQCDGVFVRSSAVEEPR